MENKKMYVNQWRIIGYRGNQNYDGLMDNNLDFEVCLDCMLTKDNVISLFFDVFKKCREVSLDTQLICEKIEVRNY